MDVPEPARGPVDLKAHRRRGIETAVPALAFVGANALFGLTAAIVATTVVSLCATALRHRRREKLGWLLPLSSAYLVARAAIGVATGSEDVYFGIGIGMSILVGIGLLASVAVRRPALGIIVPLVVEIPADVLVHPAWRRVCTVLTLLWGLQQLLVSAFHTWLLSRSSASGFVIIRTIVGWPLTAIGLTVALTWAALHLERRTGWAPLGPLTASPEEEPS